MDASARRTATIRRPASLAALLPYQLTELLDHVDKEPADGRLVLPAPEVKSVAQVRPGQRIIVRTDAASLVGHEQPDPPPVTGVAAPLDVTLPHQRVHHCGHRSRR